VSNYAEGKGPICPLCKTNQIRNRGSRKCGECHRHPGWHVAPGAPAAVAPDQQIAADRDRARAGIEQRRLKALYAEALKTIERQSADIASWAAMADTVEVRRIEPRAKAGTSEGTVVAVASDWHIEETVGPEVSGLNTYNLEIAEARATQFFQSALRLTQLLQQDIRVDNMLLALLGDFISNDIHDDLVEQNSLAPMHAIALAQNSIASGIEFLLNHSKLTLTIPCHSGNHARTTKTTRFSTENGHSLEYLMFLHLAARFRGEPRVNFLIPPGMHSYVNVYGQTIRLQHGHAIKYGGGVGGIYIPVNKAIGQWNKGRRADLDVFAHFHQLRDGGNFICNGSMIGYNAFALSIKADYEPPKQALFLMDKKRGRTCTWPILFKA